MDYCSSCRRHLNGALVCPGCGGYAPDMAPATIDSRAVPYRATGTTTGSVVIPMIPMIPMTPAAPMTPTVPAATWEYGATGTAWHDGPPVEKPAAGAGAERTAQTAAPGIEDVDDIEGAPVAPQGRAARRRQMARWKKNQRRAVVATAVALVGGGLTVMGMDRQSTDRTQAATAPDAESLGAVEEQGSQGGRSSSAETDDARRTSDTPATRSPGSTTSRDRSAAGAPHSRANTPGSPRTATSTPSAQQAQTDSATAEKTVTDALTGTPTDEATTSPATDDSGSTTDTDTDTSTDSGTDSGTDTGTSDGSSSDTATTSPSGLCLLGIVCVN